MTIFRKKLFRFGAKLLRPNLLSHFDRMIKEKGMSLDERQVRQDQNLRAMVDHCYKNVPYYRELFDELGLKSTDIQVVKDLERLPILTKDIIKSSYEKFTPKNLHELKFIHAATGGSTGIPLKYRMCQDDIDLGMAELYFDWVEAGYEMGDKIAILAGGSIVGKGKRKPMQRLKAWLKSHRNYSSYGMNDELLETYVKDMTAWGADILRGYPTAIYRMAKYIEDNNCGHEFALKAIITTAEVLQPKHKECIERVFEAKIFDTYGLGDGGISAYECNLHQGFHVNMDRSILEVTDKFGVNVAGEEGKILATSLVNYSMPFLRYDSGDLGILSTSPCACGESRPILKKILGRTTEILNIGGSTIGGPMLTILMQQVHASLYRFVQVGEYEIVVIIIKDKDYSDWDEKYILASMSSQIKNLKLTFKYVNDIPLKGDEKFKIVINEFN
jgi:phenylacetate-CoA ligase